MFQITIVEKVKKHFMSNNFFSKNHTVYEIMSKNVVETDGPQMTSQYGTYALRAGLATLHARMRMHIPMRPDTHTHPHPPTHARTHTQTSK
jgi:hypothetical protein